MDLKDEAIAGFGQYFAKSSQVKKAEELLVEIVSEKWKAYLQDDIDIAIKYGSNSENQWTKVAHKYSSEAASHSNTNLISKHAIKVI
ncbi:MAG: hypothetical protein HRT71_07675 [Flavobacteriales bacterium]|nr:hypothetical protein [Flavobacteriales bacterium]